MKNEYIITVMLLAVLAACSAPIAADCGDVVTVKTGTVTNGKVMVQEGPEGCSDWTFNVPDGDVQFVRVHWQCWMQTGDCSATFTNSDGVAQQITIPMNTRTDTYGHWECGYGTSHNYWTVNATPGSNTLSGITNCDCRWKFVDIVVDNTEPATHNGHWWLNQGLIKPVTYTTWFNGAINTSAGHTLWTAQYTHENMKIYFNGLKVDDYYGVGDYPFDVRQNSVSNIDTDESQNVTWVNVEPGSYPEFFAVAAMLAEEILIEEPDLVVTSIEPETEMMRPGTGYMVNATIKNQGDAGTGVQFDVSLWIDGSFHSKVEDVGPLAADDSTIISFTNVNPGEGCHNFTVVADCDDNVADESDEDNNAGTEHYQVGYVIAVRSNGDFDDLVTEGLARKDGSTYYIEDRTITNCAGCGITIENTTVPFVIDNCTVRDCGYDGGSLITHCNGICLENVTDGTVNGNTVDSNSHKGVSVIQSTHIDVTNNTVSNHIECPTTSYGIEIGKVQIPDETKFINITCNELYQNVYGIELIGYNCTVKGNIAQDNSIYGVYIYGRYNEVYNNTIENNDDYGIKVYNSSDNYIYWNDFIDNKYGGVQGYDDTTANTWNTPTQVNYPYKCSNAWYSYTGNYWNDHRDASDPDGIMDSSYPLDGGSAQDLYPLSVEWKLCGDANRDGGVNMMDAGVVFGYIFQSVTICNPWAADVNGDSGINMMDAGAIIGHIYQGVTLNGCCKDC